MSITNGIVSSKIYDKRDNFNLEIVNFPFLDGDIPRSASYGVYISQPIHFERVCSNVDNINNRNLSLTAKLLKQGYRYHEIRGAFLNSTKDTQSKLLNTTLLSRDGCVALPRVAMGYSVVCDCGIF